MSGIHTMPKRLRIIGLPDDVIPVVELLKLNGYDVSLYALRREEDAEVISYALSPPSASIGEMKTMQVAPAVSKKR